MEASGMLQTYNTSINQFGQYGGIWKSQSSTYQQKQGKGKKTPPIVKILPLLTLELHAFPCEWSPCEFHWGNSGTPWRPTGEKFIKEILRDLCSRESLLLLKVPTLKRETCFYVHDDLCQLLPVSNCPSLGTISELPKHLGPLAQFRGCSTGVTKNWKRCIKFIWLWINKAPI